MSITASILVALSLLTFTSCGGDKSTIQGENKAIVTANDEVNAAANHVVAISSEEQFKEKISNTSHYTIVKFEAQWCGPCKFLSPLFKEAATKLQGEYSFITVDIDDLPEIAKLYGITGVPTMMFFRGGQEVSGAQRTVGTGGISTADDLVKKIENTLPRQSSGIAAPEAEPTPDTAA